MTDWQPHARSLAAKLVRSGALAGDWRKAFEQTPRHVFVPSFYAPGGTHIGADNADDPAAFMTAVYADESLTTQLSSVPGTDLNWPTSSSTLPSLMAQMLALLDVRDGHRV